MIPSWALFVASIESDMHFNSTKIDPILFAQIALAVAVAVAGVWAASRSAQFWKEKDPQRVVIDEVSGQHLTLLIGCCIPVAGHAQNVSTNSLLGLMTPEHRA